MSFIIDSHQDLHWAMFHKNPEIHKQTSVELIKKHLKIVHLSIFHDDDVYAKASRDELHQDVLVQLNYYQSLVRDNKEFHLIRDWGDVEGVKQSKDKIGIIIHYEGAEAVHHIGVIKQLHRLGLRSLGLVMSRKNLLASPVTDDDGEGLTALGIGVVHELIDLKMIIDVAHLNEPGVRDVYEICRKRRYTFINSHCNCKEVCGHLRNASDAQLKMIKDVGGVQGLAAVSTFNATHLEVTLGDFMSHIRHAKSQMGITHLGIGSDFGGMLAKPMPDFGNTGDYPNLIEVLTSRFNPMEVDAVLWHNYYNFYKKIWG